MSLRTDGSCSKFKITAESPLESQFGPYQNIPLKGGFPCATTRGMAEEERFCTVRTYHHVSCLRCKILAFFSPVKSDQLLLPHSRPTFHFEVGKKRNKSMIPRASLDALVSFLPDCFCKNQFQSAFSFPNLSCLAKFPW